MSSGKAYLVGAGPGCPSLITVRGLELLRLADVVIYDHLVARELLDEVRPTAERIFAGKDPQHHAISQAAITATLVYHVRRGKQVVRLKGGDPFVFGRGGEEALALVQAGLPFEIVPGVTSAVAVPAYAGIPITHRGLAMSVAFVTGHVASDQPTQQPNWHALAQLDTLVVLMGLQQVDAICAALQAAGRDPATPAMAISWGTTMHQQSVQATLSTLAAALVTTPLPTPCVLVIGAVVGLAETLAWFQPSSAAQGFPDLTTQAELPT